MLLKATSTIPIFQTVTPVRAHFRDQTQQIQSVTRSHSERGFICDNMTLLDGSRCFSKGLNIGSSSQFRTMAEVTSLQTRCDFKPLLRSVSGVDSQSRFRCSSDSGTNEKQLRSLSSYFGKLQDYGKNLNPSKASNKATEKPSSVQLSSKKELEILDTYLDKLDKDENLEEDPAIFVKPAPSSFDEPKIKGSVVVMTPKRSPSLQQDDETSDLYLICTLASINIAVVLFEIASPVRNSELELSSLPLLYGAKVNHLIMIGEWWRLVTPMFLHCGIFDIGLGCWALLTFGPKVCKGYGSFTFLLIYFLGGISGNLISFLHTPEPTVGGTAPIYAIIGAWLIYQNQNKGVIAKEVSESMFQKAIIITALGFILSHFGPIDEWTHFGAAFTGVAYGFLTSPTLELDDSTSKTRQEEGIALVKRQSDPCKSLFLFSVFLLVLSSLLFFVEPPLNELVSESF